MPWPARPPPAAGRPNETPGGVSCEEFLYSFKPPQSAETPTSATTLSVV